MDTITIKLTDHISLNKGITPDEAEPILNKEIEAFKNGNNVILDFEGVEMLTTAFLNVVIGNLYENHTSEELNAMLKLVNYDEPTAIRIKKVTDNAKAFYKNAEEYSNVVKEVINENR